MNDTTQKLTGWTRTAVWVLVCCLALLAVVTADYFCMKHQVYGWQTGLTVLLSIGVVAFVMAAIALFRPHKNQP